MNRRKKLFWYGICLMISVVMTLIFSSRTSPFYSLLLGDYSGNSASAAMLAGKYWLQGDVPYRDFYTLKAPGYLLIQALGWLLRGRMGIMILQIISLTVFLILTERLLRYASGKYAKILTVTAVFFYAALCGGGNSAAEWCLPWIVGGCCLLTEVYQSMACDESEERRKTEKGENSALVWKMLKVGFISGMIALIQFISGGLLYGLTAVTLAVIGKKRGRKCIFQCLAAFLAGCLLPVAAAVLYFMVCGAAESLLNACAGNLLLLMSDGCSSSAVIVHKAVKCGMILPLFLAICQVWRKKNHIIAAAMFWPAVVWSILMMYSDNSWVNFLSGIPAVLFGVTVLLNTGRVRAAFSQACVMAAVSVLICLTPLKNYLLYLIDGVPEVVEEFCTDLQAYIEEMDFCRVMMIDTDCSYFLHMDIRPICRYFTDQTRLGTVSQEAVGEMEHFLNGEIPVDVWITTEKGWVGQNLENYDLVQVYCKKGGNLCVYLPKE